MDDYINSIGGAESTEVAYRQDLKAFKSWCVDNDLAPLNAAYDTLNRFFSYEKSKGLATKTRVRRQGTLKRFHEYLVRAGVLRESPMADSRVVPLPKEDPGGDSRYLELEQLRRLIAEAEGRGYDWLAIVVLMGIHGLQPSEVSALRIRDLSERRGKRMLRIPGRKRGEWTPLVSITARVLDHLVDGRAPDSPLVPNDAGNAITYSNIRYRLRQLADAAGIEPAPDSRALRNTAAALAFSRAVPMDQIQDLLGSESLSHVWKFPEQVREYHYQHAAEAVAHTVLGGGQLDEAERLLMDNAVHPAIPTMAAGAAMEHALRQWVREKDVPLPTEEMRMKLSTYGAALRGAGELSNSDVQSLTPIMEARDHAAHGWYELITPGVAHRTIQEVRRILGRHNRPMP